MINMINSTIRLSEHIHTEDKLPVCLNMMINSLLNSVLISRKGTMCRYGCEEIGYSKLFSELKHTIKNTSGCMCTKTHTHLNVQTLHTLCAHAAHGSWGFGVQGMFYFGNVVGLVTLLR